MIHKPINTRKRKNKDPLKKIDCGAALLDAEGELRRAEQYAGSLRKAIPILRQRVTDNASTHN
jgi:hypothetical protein